MRPHGPVTSATYVALWKSIFVERVGGALDRRGWRESLRGEEKWVGWRMEHRRYWVKMRRAMPAGSFTVLEDVEEEE